MAGHCLLNTQLSLCLQDNTPSLGPPPPSQSPFLVPIHEVLVFGLFFLCSLPWWFHLVSWSERASATHVSYCLFDISDRMSKKVTKFNRSQTELLIKSPHNVLLPHFKKKHLIYGTSILPGVQAKGFGVILDSSSLTSIFNLSGICWLHFQVISRSDHFSPSLLPPWITVVAFQWDPCYYLHLPKLYSQSSSQNHSLKT